MIPYGRQSIDDDDIAAVVEVLKGDWLTQGPGVVVFEEALARVTGAANAVAFSSGTAALHACIWAAGLGPGDVVVTSGLSFAASASCARYAGATAAFVDIDPTTLNIDLNKVGRPDALVAVHYAGLPVDLSRLSPRPPVVIEDAAHALGATTPAGPVGNCANSDMCAFSFHPVKAITTGEGGAVTTNDATLAERLRRFRNHGIAKVPEHGGWHYEISDLGYNFRITDIQAALGTSQLGKLGNFIGRRQAIADRYRQRLAELPLVLPPSAPDGFTHAYHLFPVQVPYRRRVYDGLRAEGIGVQVHYEPIYRHPLYARDGVLPAGYPETERVCSSILSLPVYPGLSEREQDEVIAALERVLAGLPRAGLG